MKFENVEDLLEHLIGFNGDCSVQIEKADCTILYSIGRQVSRGKALTDRQLDVVKKKLDYYKAGFDFDSTVFDSAISTLRMPLREIDRSKYVKVVDQDNSLWIKIRFPFSKKLIVDLQDNIAAKFNHIYSHKQGSHEHFVKLTERTVPAVVNLFKDKQFVIDHDLLEMNQRLDDISNQPEKYIPGVYNNKLCNLPDAAVEYLQNDIGALSETNTLLYQDRSIMFGLANIDDELLQNSKQYYTTLSSKIANRKKSSIFVSSKKYELADVFTSLKELKRFPLCIFIPAQKEYETLKRMFEATDGVVDPADQTVLFRLDNSTNAHFNNFVKENKINNPLAKNIKIVYIIENKKIPKPLFNSDVELKSMLYTENGIAIRQDLFLDLNIQYDEVVSQYHKHAHYKKEFGGIEEI